MSIRTTLSGFRLLQVVALALTCTAVLILSLTIWYLRSYAVADASRDAGNLAVVLAEQTNHSIQSIELMLDEWKERIEGLGARTQNDFRRLLQSEDTHRMLTERMAHLSQASYISLVDENGWIVNSTHGWPMPPIDFSDRQYFQHVKNNKDKGVYVSTPMAGRLGGIRTIVFTKRVDNANSEFLGAIVIGVRLSSFHKIYGSIDSLSDLSFLFLRNDGTVLIRHPDREDRSGERMPAASPWHQLVAQGGGHYRSPGYFDNEARLVAVRPLRNYPLVINVAASETAALATWRFQAIALGIGILLVMFCSVLLLKALGKQFRRVERSEAALTQKAHELERAGATVDAALNNMSQGLAMFDVTQRLVVCNKRYAGLYGLNDEQTKPGTTLRAILEHQIARSAAPDDHESYVEDQLNEATENKPHQVTNRLSDGRYISVIRQPMIGGGWTATHEDVTEAKRRDETFRLLFEGNPVPMTIMDLESARYLAVNDAAVVHYGYSREQFLSMTAYDIRPAADWQRLTQVLQELRVEGLTKILAQHTTSDGSVIDVCVYSQVMTWMGHKVGMGAIHDITNAKKSEDELRRTQQFLDTVVENVPLPMIVKNPHDRRFTLVNRAFEKCFGIPRNEIIGKTVHDLFSTEEANIIVGHDNEALQSDRPLIIGPYSLHTRSNGDRIFVAKRVAIREPNGIPQYLLTVLDDVTDRKSIEDQLRQSLKMEAIGNLTGGVAHDFNNLLTIMIGNLDMLREENTERLQTVKKVDAIMGAALRGAELTKQMLVFSRRQPLQPRYTDLNVLTDRTAQLLTRTLGEGVRLEFRKSPDANPIVVDEAQLEAAVVNIAVNARDAMPDGGTLTISTDKVIFNDEDVARRPGLAPGEHTILKIADTGIGMSSEVIGHIFEPFYTTKGSGKGTGLGLSMVYGFVKQSGGYVGVTSTPGKGTTFELCFPAAATALGADTAVASRDWGIWQPAGEVVLAVDDQPEVRATAVAHLTALGYQVLEADCAQAALEKLAAGAKIDLLFTDIVMPGGLNGVELAKLARAKHPDLKVLYTSGYPGADYGDRSGFDLEGTLLTKPYRKQELARAVAEVLAAA